MQQRSASLLIHLPASAPGKAAKDVSGTEGGRQEGDPEGSLAWS